MRFSESIFAQRFQITRQDLENYLSDALSQGGDYADLYFEYMATSSIGIDESMVKSASQGVSVGVGVRVIAGERTGYAYSGDLSPEKVRKAARVAACIASSPSKVDKFDLSEGALHNLYIQGVAYFQLHHGHARQLHRKVRALHVLLRRLTDVFHRLRQLSALDDLRIERKNDESQGPIFRKQFAANDVVGHHPLDQALVLGSLGQDLRKQRRRQAAARRRRLACGKQRNNAARSVHEL